MSGCTMTQSVLILRKQYYGNYHVVIYQSELECFRSIPTCGHYIQAVARRL